MHLKDFLSSTSPLKYNHMTRHVCRVIVFHWFSLLGHTDLLEELYIWSSRRQVMITSTQMKWKAAQAGNTSVKVWPL